MLAHRIRYHCNYAMGKVQSTKCVYVGSHLRIQFNLTGLLGKGMVVVCMCVCTQSF